MRRWVITALVAVGATLVAQDPAVGQVKRVEMDIAGYLCGF